MRNLATIQTISQIDDIPGKDRIGLAHFKSIGYKVIVNKVDMKVGDKVIYFEQDSVLPNEPKYEFLRARCWTEKFKGFRIKSMKMGGVYSEGLALPFEGLLYTDPPDTEDVTEILGVVKYDLEKLEEDRLTASREKKYKDSPIKSWLFSFSIIRRIFYIFNKIFAKKPRDRWPKFLQKTDETRVQVLPQVFEPVDFPIYVTEKLDGQSVTYALHNNKFIVCSRNFELPPDNSNYWKTAKMYDVEAKLRAFKKEFGIELAIQCEQCGPGIQGNKYNFDDLKIFMFNAFNVKTGKYYGLPDLFHISKSLQIVTVPVLCYDVPFIFKNVDELLEYADGYSIYGGGKVLREGVVVRAVNPLPPSSKMANMWSFKVISPSFQIKHQ